MNKKIKDKYKNISAYSFTTYNNELVVSFDGFEDQNDILEFEIKNAQQSNEHVENFAREKLNLVYPEEELISFEEKENKKDEK